MQKRGLKRIEDDLNHEGYNPVIDEGRNGRGMSAPNANSILVRPFDMNEKTNDPHTSIAVGVLTFLLTFIGTMLFGLIYLLVLETQAAAADSTSAFIIATTGAIFTLGPMMWTFDPDLRIHTIPGIIVASFGTLDLGLISMIVFLVANLGGYAVSGVIVRALLGVQTVADTATGVASYWLVWAATSVTIFVYIYNDKFEFHREYEVDNHSRAARWTALWSFGFRLALYGLGVRTLNSGLYLAALILSNDGDLTPADTVVDWAFYLFVPMLASAGTAFLLYYAASFFIRFKDTTLSIYSRRTYRAAAPDYEQTETRVVGRYGADSRARKRNIDASF